MEDSNLQIKLILRGPGYEIITEGELSSLFHDIDALSEFYTKLSETFIQPSEIIVEADEVPTEEEVEATPTADIPAIRPVESNLDNIRALFDTLWGNQPRKMAEIIKALEVNGVYISMSTMSASLLYLVRGGELRRIRREGRWAYYKIPSRE